MNKDQRLKELIAKKKKLKSIHGRKVRDRHYTEANELYRIIEKINDNIRDLTGDK